jgi:secreted trypsin-like serine protease
MRMTIVASAVFIALIVAGGPAHALVGADLADLSLQRYTVSVETRRSKCTGVALAQDIVLTAAHCAQDANNLWVGGHRGFGAPTAPPVELSPVAQAVVHPGYDPRQPGSPDLALLKLAKPLPDRFAPAYFGGPVPGAGDDLIAVGYGKNAAVDPKAGTILRMALLRVGDRFPTYLTLVSARDATTEAAPGDSGGPVFAYRGMPTLVAIIVGRAAFESVAIPIAPNYAWINETMEKLEGR